MNLQQTLHDKAEKNITKHDEVRLKQLACRHPVEYQKMHEDGQKYCEVCHVSEADVERRTYG